MSSLSQSAELDAYLQGKLKHHKQLHEAEINFLKIASNEATGGGILLTVWKIDEWHMARYLECGDLIGYFDETIKDHLAEDTLIYQVYTKDDYKTELSFRSSIYSR